MQTSSLAFSSLHLPEQVVKGIESAGFKNCTPIQEKVFPLSLKGKDVAAQAQTGTGKTAAFLITILTRLLTGQRKKHTGSCPRAFIVAPTRELVVQIYEEAKLLGQHTDFSMLAVYGGVDYQKQRERLRLGVDILIGTPGRLIDYYKQRTYNLKSTEILVVDEADRMFDMGFIKDLRYILRKLPPFEKRQTMLFSATLSHRVMELAYEFMNLAEKVSIEPEQVTAERVDQILYHAGRREKFPLLLGLLKKESGAERVLVFVNTKREAEHLTDRLKANDFKAAVISGDIPQNKRMRILKDFKEGHLTFLVATDVASRGIHIDGVTHVINYDLPQDAEDYVHRIGRTARAGALGKAISFADEDLVFHLPDIEEYIGQKIPSAFPEDDDFFWNYKRSAPRKRAPIPEKSGAGDKKPMKRRGPPRRKP